MKCYKDRIRKTKAIKYMQDGICYWLNDKETEALSKLKVAHTPGKFIKQVMKVSKRAKIRDLCAELQSVYRSPILKTVQGDAWMKRTSSAQLRVVL